MCQIERGEDYMKKCREIESRLIDFVEGALSRNKQKKFEDHLADCSECRELVARFETVYEMTEAEPELEVSPDFYTKVQAKVDSYEENHVSLADLLTIFSGRLKPAVAAVSLLLAITAGYFMGHGITDSQIYEVNGSGDLFSEYYNLDMFDAVPDNSLPDLYLELGENGGPDE